VPHLQVVLLHGRRDAAPDLLQLQPVPLYVHGLRITGAVIRI